MVLASQHSNSGSAATHFTSASLRRDAKEDAVAMVNIFQKATSALLQAKCSEAVSLTRKLAEVDNQICELRSQLAERDAQRGEVEEEVRTLRARLAEIDGTRG